MSQKEDSAKVIRLPRRSRLNSGIVVFAVVIFYVLYHLYAYITSDPIAEYEVQKGMIAVNNVYRGLVLRDETVVYADQSGFVNYYLKNASKVSVNDVIYSIDVSGNIASKIRENGSSLNGLTQEHRARIANDIHAFSEAYDSNCFYEVYGFKNDMNSQLRQTLNTYALAALENEVLAAEANHTFFRKRPEKPGVIAYYTDGYESKTPENFSESDFSPASYEKQNLESNIEITAGEAVYKQINSEEWNILVPIPMEVAEELSENSTVSIRFFKNSITTTVPFSIMKRGETYFLNLQMLRYMVYYLNDRYIDIELMLSEQVGLKIPKSAIVSKKFFTIPEEYFSLGGDSEKPGLLVRKFLDEGTEVNWVAPTIYYEDQGLCYVDSESVKSGDVIQKPDSSETYVIGRDEDFLEGVYNINKGYAVFKQIDVKYQNSEYAIVETNTTYGISLYDHIALNGSQITEDQLVR